MLAQVHHIGTTDHHNPARLYAIQTTRGARFVLHVTRERGRRHNPDRVGLSIVDDTRQRTYSRTYAPAGEMDQGAPTVADLPDGYHTLAAFVRVWELATPAQRADLCQGDADYTGGDRGDGPFAWHIRQERKVRDLDKWPDRPSPERARVLPGPAVQIINTYSRADGCTYSDDPAGWHEITKRDLYAAIKGARVVRIGTATVRASVLRELARIHGRRFYLRDEAGALGFMSPDRRTRCTIRHGAGDPTAGRAGWDTRIVFSESPPLRAAAD